MDILVLAERVLGLIREYGSTTILLGVVWALCTDRLVTGANHNDVRHQRDLLLDIALRTAGTAERAINVAEVRSREAT